MSYDSSLERCFFHSVRRGERLSDLHRPPAAGPWGRTGRRLRRDGWSKAFGTKAGDVFTRITIGVAVVWVALAGITGYAMSKESRDRFQSQATNEPALLPATAGQAAAGGGGGVGKFDAGNNPANTKAGAANNAAAPTTGERNRPRPNRPRLRPHRLPRRRPRVPPLPTRRSPLLPRNRRG